MVVVVICERFGRIRDAFTERGHLAISVDLAPTESEGLHIQRDCRELDYTGVDLLIANPDCTYICNSGVRWFYRDGIERWKKSFGASLFFRWILELPVPRIVVENPIPHKYALDVIGRKYDQIIQPWQFGHGETKATCLWLKGLPPLLPTNIVQVPKQKYSRVALETPSPDRWLKRSITYTGIADAMADQWGILPKI